MIILMKKLEYVINKNCQYSVDISEIMSRRVPVVSITINEPVFDFPKYQYATIFVAV